MLKNINNDKMRSIDTVLTDFVPIPFRVINDMYSGPFY